MAERMRIQCQGCFGTFLELVLYGNTLLTENEGWEKRAYEQKAVSAAGCTIATLQEQSGRQPPGQLSHPAT